MLPLNFISLHSVAEHFNLFVFLTNNTFFIEMLANIFPLVGSKNKFVKVRHKMFRRVLLCISEPYENFKGDICFLVTKCHA